jgi:hypothetical protein
VIAMLVGHKDGSELTGIQADIGETAFKLTQRETAVDQQARAPGVEQRGVAAAAAAEGNKAH